MEGGEAGVAVADIHGLFRVFADWPAERITVAELIKVGGEPTLRGRKRKRCLTPIVRTGMRAVDCEVRARGNKGTPGY